MADIEDKLKKIEEDLKNRPTNAMLSQMRQDLETLIDEKIQIIEKSVKSLEKDFELHQKEIEDMHKSLEILRDAQENLDKKIDIIVRINMRLEKVLSRLKAVEEDIGMEESIDVSKIPPSILQLVYQYTLDDAINALKSFVGTQDTEVIINEILMDVRSKTSGTELFKYKDGKIVTTDIVKAIDKKLISPKQVHLTYVEILNKIREYVPGYKPKNFKALLRVKGQEYTIENTTQNRVRIEMIERNISTLKSTIASQENALREDMLFLRKDLEKKVEEKISELSEEIDGIISRIEGLHKDINTLMESIASIAPYVERYRVELMNKVLDSMSIDGNTIEEIANINSLPTNIAMEIMDVLISTDQVLKYEDKFYPIVKIEDEILDIIGDKGASFSNIKKEMKMDKELLNQILVRLIDKGKIEERKHGKGKKYIRR